MSAAQDRLYVLCFSVGNVKVQDILNHFFQLRIYTLLILLFHLSDLLLFSLLIQSLILVTQDRYVRIYHFGLTDPHDFFRQILRNLLFLTYLVLQINNLFGLQKV